MERKLETKVGAAVWATRKFVVEPSLRADQTGTRVPSISLTRDRKSTTPVGPDLHDPHDSEVSQDLFWVEHLFSVQIGSKEVMEALSSARK